MRCEELETRVNDILDERGAPLTDEAVSEHVRGCAACAAWVGALDAGLAGLARRARPQGSPDLPERVLRALAERNALVERRWRWARVGVGMAIAASLALALIPSWTGDPDVPTAAKPDPAEFDQLAGDVTASYLALAQSTGQSVSGMLELAPRWSEGDAAVASDVANHSPWQSEVATGLRPVAESTVGAVYSLWQVIPLAEEPRS